MDLKVVCSIVNFGLTPTEVEMDLSDENKKGLLRLARVSIESELKGEPSPSLSLEGRVLREPRGAFVTLKIDDELRGCIGYVEPRLPLWQAIEEVALKAAFGDPRFSPLSEDELPRTEIEISVLSPLKRISDVSEIEVGKHGLVVDAGYARGLLLPQVAVEYGWTREQFLSHTSLKAGLLPDAWKWASVSLFVFTTEVFSESMYQELHH